MRKKLIVVIALLCYATGIFAQAPAVVKPYVMYENSMMKPKQGKQQAFEKAVVAHIAKFHNADPYKARLSRIDVGNNSDGWYIFSMGPCMYSQLDGEPEGNKAHDDDWNLTIEPLVEQYGETMHWKLNEDISYTPAGYLPERVDVWQVKIKPGQRYRFEELMKKMSKVAKDKNYASSVRVFNNDLWNGSGYNAAIVYGFNKWADLDMDVQYQQDYEAVYGEGSWVNFWRDWRDAVELVDEHIRTFMK